MFLQGEPIVKDDSGVGPTISLGVPTICTRRPFAPRRTTPTPISRAFAAIVGPRAAAVPRVMIEAFRDRFGINVIQGWGNDRDQPLWPRSRSLRRGTPADIEM